MWMAEFVAGLKSGGLLLAEYVISFGKRKFLYVLIPIFTGVVLALPVVEIIKSPVVNLLHMPAGIAALICFTLVVSSQFFAWTSALTIWAYFKYAMRRGPTNPAVSRCPK